MTKLKRITLNTELLDSNAALSSLPRWEVLDIAIEVATAGPDNAFAITFGALFRGPEDVVLRIPGFYDGDGIYVLRFSPPDQGMWAFETYASVPELAGLRGTIEATAPVAGRHGPIVVDAAHPQRFAYADGTPYFLLAFECDWLFALDLTTPNDFTRTQTLLNHIAAQGFNHVVMNVYAHDVLWEKDPSLQPEHEFGAPTVFPFGGNNDAPDFSTLNVAFFQHVDCVIQALDERGIVAHVMIYVWNKGVAWPAMTSWADNVYFDYVIARYQAFTNIVWDISKEALTHGRCDMAYIHERIRRLRRQDAYARLLTVHDYGYCQQFPHNVDFISIQTWASGLYHVMLNVQQAHPDKPIFNIEHGGYEEGPYVVFPGDYVNAEVCLERSYACVFAGTYTTYYWQDTSWNVIIPDPMALPEAKRPKFAYYQYMADLFKRYDFTKLVPAESHSSSGHRLTSPGLNLYLLPKDNYAMHTTLLREANSEVRVTWFNPLTGEYLHQDGVSPQHWQEFKSPWAGQMTVLILAYEAP